ncbi:TPA: hypothetical protein N0F65_002459 [Lagenidium giganteum]|uniref:Uncharacterized protein n=1 Tax=Lagenidium giganteum TaxID=4803 RepID=A0AAV2YL01_9STRA|nr:TPA: hypothetical protein N0F65_002459 [Lagenidium giganteum]
MTKAAAASAPVEPSADGVQPLEHDAPPSTTQPPAAVARKSSSTNQQVAAAVSAVSATPSSSPSPSASPTSAALPSNRAPSTGEAGEVVGDYVLGETIGKGTFGKVKIGLHMITGEKVAIKILEKKRIVEVADVERVAREIKILKRNRHINVIQLYEVIDSPERIFLIMEHADSGEMFEYIVAHHRIREPEAVVFFQQIVEGLDYLHANEVTHRDLKPENLLLQTSAATSGYLVKIVDFGLSNTHDNGRLLRTACGSPCYAAPEMIEGKMYKGPLADIWSLGVILFAMVCGYLPFEDSNTNQLYRKILNADYKMPPFLSHNVQDLIRRVLETSPEKRYTMDHIRQHPWFNSVRPAVPKVIYEREDAIMKDMILNQLETLGFNPADVMLAVQNRQYNNQTASYFLLYNKLLRVLKDHNIQLHRERRSSASDVPVISTSVKSGGSRSHLQGLGAPVPATASAGLALAVTGKNTSSTTTTAAAQSHAASPSPRGKGVGTTSALTTVPHGGGGSARRRSQPFQEGTRAGASSPSPAQPCSPAMALQQPSRPSSVRSGRNLVLLTNGTPVTTAPVPPQEKRVPFPKPPSGATSTSKVSVSNGMVVLAPLPEKHDGHGRTSPHRQSATGRRHTLEAHLVARPPSSDHHHHSGVRQHQHHPQTHSTNQPPHHPPTHPPPHQHPHHTTTQHGHHTTEHAAPPSHAARDHHAPQHVTTGTPLPRGTADSTSGLVRRRPSHNTVSTPTAQQHHPVVDHTHHAPGASVPAAHAVPPKANAKEDDMRAPQASAPPSTAPKPSAHPPTSSGGNTRAAGFTGVI